jgi:hypothetical protein
MVPRDREPLPHGGVAAPVVSATCGNVLRRTPACARARDHTPGGVVNGFLQAFQANLHLYEAVAGVLLVAIVCFLLLLLRGTKLYRAPRDDEHL